MQNFHLQQATLIGFSVDCCLLGLPYLQLLQFNFDQAMLRLGGWWVEIGGFQKEVQRKKTLWQKR
jgi:hypothetical protein